MANGNSWPWFTKRTLALLSCLEKSSSGKPWADDCLSGLQLITFARSFGSANSARSATLFVTIRALAQTSSRRVRCCWRPGDLAWAKEKWCCGCRRSSFPRQTVFLANRAGALTNYQVALFRILWYERKSLFFTKFLRYPTFSDTLVRPKLIVFSRCFWRIPLFGILWYDRQSLFFIMFLVYPTF